MPDVAPERFQERCPPTSRGGTIGGLSIRARMRHGVLSPPRYIHRNAKTRPSGRRKKDEKKMKKKKRESMKDDGWQERGSVEDKNRRKFTAASGVGDERRSERIAYTRELIQTII